MPKKTFLNLPEEKKKKILKSADKEFSRVPIEKVSIQNIIEQAEIPRGSFYQYFEDKEDLFDYMMNIKIGDIEKKINDMVKKEDGNIIKICINMYDQMIQMGQERKNNKFFKQIVENVRTRDNLMFIKKVEMKEKIEKTLYSLYDKNKEILNIKNQKEFELVIEILFAITRRRIVASLNYKNSEEAREEFLKEIEFIKNGILK